MENVATDRGEERDIPSGLKGANRYDAAIKMAQQKKVSFQSEQLAFAMHVDNTGLFAGE